MNRHPHTRRRARDADRRLHRAIIRDLPRLKSYPGVCAVALGHKEKHGKITRRLCVKIYVEKKEPEATLGDRVLPRSTVVLWPVDRLRYRARRMMTDVVEVKSFSLAVGARDFFTAVPVGAQIGCGIGPIGPGTQGCVVRRRADNARLMMTAAHLVIGQPGTVPRNVALFQPDSPAPRFSLGMTTGGFLGIMPTLGAYVDVAFYELTNHHRSAVNTSWRSELPAVRGALSLDEICQARVPVQKVGAATGYTTGTFSAFHHEWLEPKLGRLLQVIEYVSADTTTALADHGDSGAAVLSAAPASNGALVGLLFAVSDDCRTALVIPFATIRDGFGVEVE